MLKFSNVSFAYAASSAMILKDISFEVADNSFVSIIGSSGAGKTTIFRLLNGLETPQSGEISINGEEPGRKSNLTGYMPQQDLLFPWRNAWQNVSLPMQVQGVGAQERRKNAYEMLERVGLLEYAEKYPRELSGGMRQRVSFARTLCTGADILLLDEPFSSLDSITRSMLHEWLIEQRKKFEKTILFITHDVDEAIFLSEKILVISGKPVDTVREYTVPLPSQRDRRMLTGADVEQLKEELLGILSSEAEA